MKYGQWCLAVSGASILLIGTAAAQSAADCRKGEFRGGAPVFYYDKACMAKLKASNSSASGSNSAVVKKAVTKKTKRSPKIKSVQKLLAGKGYKVGKPDGLMGPNTSKAINSYYKKNGLKKGSGSKTNAVLAHLKQSSKNKSAQRAKKAARVAAIKKAVAAKRAAAKKQAVAKSGSAANSDKAIAESSKIAAARRAARVAAIKKAVAAKKVAAGKKVVSASVKSEASTGTDHAAKAAAARKAKVAAIKKAVAAKKVAAAQKAKPSFLQRMKTKAVNLVSGKSKADEVKVAKVATPIVSDDARKAAAARSAKVAAIKKAVAAKRAAAKKKVVAPSAKASAPKAKSDAKVVDLQNLLKAKGLYKGKSDGTMNIDTRKSVISYYHENDVDIGQGSIVQGVHKHLKGSSSTKKDAVAAKAASANKAARVAAIKKAVAAKRAAAKKKAVAPTAKASAPKAKSDAKVVDLQNLLKAKGLYKGKSDGTMNIDTRKSVINYYHENDVDIGSGSIVQGVHKHLKGDSSTAKKVVAPKAKKAAATSSPKKTLGNKVVAIQEMLAKKGMYQGKTDGILNRPTRKAILGYYKKAKVKRGSDTIINSVYNHLKAS